MDYFHLEAKVVSRGSGRSVIAAAAYASCSRLYNDYDGLTHDYTRKHGCLYSEVFLPVMQPPYEAGRYKTILLLSKEPMNVRRMKVYETNKQRCGRSVSAKRAYRG